jgi:manganese/zinc/iron transport system permease protein
MNAWELLWGSNIGLWMLAISLCVAISCALPGSFLVMRRMSMTGDAISHSVLPGLVIGFIASGDASSPWLMIGAALSAWLAVYCVEWLSAQMRVKEDAATGMMFTAFFALGLLLMRKYASRVDLDPDCVLMGSLEALVATADEGQVPDFFWFQVSILVAVVVAMMMGYRRWVATSFDAELARLCGLKVALWRQALLALVSMVTVSSFQAVGAVLVVALLIVPGATGVLLCRRVPGVLLTACLHGMISCVSGIWLAFAYDANAAASIVLAGAFWFGMAWLIVQIRKACERVTASD